MMSIAIELLVLINQNSNEDGLNKGILRQPCPLLATVRAPPRGAAETLLTRTKRIQALSRSL